MQKTSFFLIFIQIKWRKEVQMSWKEILDAMWSTCVTWRWESGLKKHETSPKSFRLNLEDLRMRCGDKTNEISNKWKWTIDKRYIRLESLYTAMWSLTL